MPLMIESFRYKEQISQLGQAAQTCNLSSLGGCNRKTGRLMFTWKNVTQRSRKSTILGAPGLGEKAALPDGTKGVYHLGMGLALWWWRRCQLGA